MKTAHEILTKSKYYPSAKLRDWYPTIILAMQEYANQFRNPHPVKEKIQSELDALILLYFKPCSAPHAISMTNTQITCEIQSRSKIRIVNRNKLGSSLKKLGFPQTRTGQGRFYWVEKVKTVSIDVSMKADTPENQ